MNIDWMWVWWSLTVALCAWKLIEGIFRPARMLEWPFIACAMWAYFYGYMGYQAKLNLSAYLGNGMAAIGQFVALLCLIGLLVGWSVGKRVRVSPASQQPTYSYGLAWTVAFCLILIGAAGAYSVAQEASEGDLDFQTTSAYWYLLFLVGYPGLSIAIWALLKMKSPVRFLLWALTIVALVLFLMPNMINARRGPLYPAIMILLIVPSLSLRRPPNPLIFCGSLIAAAIVMLLFLQVRSVTYNGGSWSTALSDLSLTTAVERGDEPDDNEYVNNCQMIGTVYKTGKYEYGTGHLELLVHWVPRAVWRHKPILGEGYHPFIEEFDDMEVATGVRLLGNGAAWSGVADSFLEYGFFCPVFWFVLGFGMGIVYAKVIHGKAPQWMCAYVGFICGSHWLISQSFSAAFVPVMYFESVPIAVFLLLWFYRLATKPPQKMRRPLAPSLVPHGAAP